MTVDSIGPRSCPKVLLPNGKSIFCSRQDEAVHLYNQVYGSNIYYQHGIGLDPGAIVVDAGANIGMFSLYTLERYSVGQLAAIEPAPKTFAVLKANLSGFAEAQVLNCGVGYQDCEEIFTYFPDATCASGFYTERDIRNLVNLRRSQILANRSAASALQGSVGEEVLEYLASRSLRMETAPLKIYSISTIMRQLEFRRIDLLKLDIEGKEWEAIRGIRQSDWDHIHQVVAEIHDIHSFLPGTTQLLKERGYRITVTKGPRIGSYEKGMLYAVRERLH